MVSNWSKQLATEIQFQAEQKQLNKIIIYKP